MPILSIVLFGAGLLVSAISGIWFLVVAFQRSVLWGLAVLFLPFANFVFLAKAWAEAKTPFAVQVVGLVLLVGAFFTLPSDALSKIAMNQLDMSQMEMLEETVTPEPETVADPIANLSIDEVQARLAALRTREVSLRERKAALAPGDIASAQALSAEINAYNEELMPLLARQQALSGSSATNAAR